MKQYLIILYISIALVSCHNKQKTKKENYREISSLEDYKLHYGSGLFVFLNEEEAKEPSTNAPHRDKVAYKLARGGNIRFFSIIAYDIDTPFGDKIPAYYEISQPSDPATKAVCGKLYWFPTRRKTQDLNDINYYYHDRNGAWRTYYISDTTQQYGYFYIQRHNDKRYFGKKIRVVPGDSSKIRNFGGFYWAISSLPYRLITEEDVLQRKINEKRE